MMMMMKVMTMMTMTAIVMEIEEVAFGMSPAGMVVLECPQSAQKGLWARLQRRADPFLKPSL